MKLCVSKHSHIPEAVRACDRRLTQFVTKTMPVCFATTGNYIGFVDIWFHVGPTNKTATLITAHTLWKVLM